MAVDLTYTGGVIAAREKYLLKDKLSRMCELAADDAFRVLSESGFGGTEAVSVYDYDKLVTADDRAIDDFIREYAPTFCERAYLLAPRDFHNAKAFVKAGYLNCDVSQMLAPEGLVSLDTFSSCFKSGDFSALSGELGESLKGAIEEANALEKEVSGAQIGVIFDRAMYAYLLAACKKNSALKKMVREKIDMTNILSVLRSEDEAQAEKYYITGGKVSFEKLVSLLGDDVASDFSYAVSPDFFKAAISAKRKKLPMTEAEKLKDSCEYDYLNKNKYELKKSQPFLYYVFRRRLENENVRIIFVCLLSGMSEREIKARLRAI